MSILFSIFIRLLKYNVEFYNYLNSNNNAQSSDLGVHLPVMLFFVTMGIFILFCWFLISINILFDEETNNIVHICSFQEIVSLKQDIKRQCARAGKRF